MIPSHHKAALALAALVITAPAFGAHAADASLFGDYAWFSTKTDDEVANGPRDDARCEAFVKNEWRREPSPESLKIGPKRMKASEEDSIYTGKATFGPTVDGKTRVTVLSEGEEGTSKSTGTITQRGKRVLAIALKTEGGSDFSGFWCKR